MLDDDRKGMRDMFGVGRPTPTFGIDAALAVVAGLLTAAFAVWLFSRLDFEVMCRSIDVWFDSDPGRIVAALQSRFDKMHDRSNLHPFWSIGVTTPFIALTELGGVAARPMVATYVATSAAVFGAAVYVALRLLRLTRADSFLLLALCLSTSSAWLWFGIPETYLLGAVSVVIPLIWLTVPRGIHDLWSAPLQSVVALSITITNWVAGLGAALLALGLRRALHASMIAFTIGGIIAVLQYRFFPQSGGYFNIWYGGGMSDYGAGGTLLQHIQSFFLSTVAAPMPDLLDVADGFRMSVEDGAGDRLSRLQLAAPTGSPVGLAALALWGLIVARGLWAALRGAVGPKITLFVLSMIGFNLVLHAAYGVETFLYSLHFLPFFTFVASWSLLPARGRMVMRGAIAAAIMLGVVHNLALFETMANWHNAIPPAAVAHPHMVHSCM